MNEKRRMKLLLLLWRWPNHTPGVQENLALLQLGQRLREWPRRQGEPLGPRESAQQSRRVSRKVGDGRCAPNSKQMGEQSVNISFAAYWINLLSVMSMGGEKK